MFYVNVDTFAAICFTSSISFFENYLDNVENVHSREIFCPDFDVIDREQIKLNGDFKCYFDTFKFNPFITECEDENGLLYSCNYKDCKDEYDELNDKRCQTLVLKCSEKNEDNIKTQKSIYSYNILSPGNKTIRKRNIKFGKVTANIETEVLDYNDKERGKSPVSFASKKYLYDNSSIEKENFSMCKVFDSLINHIINGDEEIENIFKLKKCIYSPVCQIIFASIIYIILFIIYTYINIREFL
uniref:Fam-e protein n=1 Tax=Strongyloides venezuelensis TaxID=75913 RepID=A0A0K0EU66_STRVS